MNAPLHWLTEHILGQNYAAWDPEKVRAAVREIADAQVERFVDLWNTEAGALDAAGEDDVVVPVPIPERAARTKGRGSVPGGVPASPGDARGERVQLPPDRSALETEAFRRWLEANGREWRIARDAVVNRAREVVAETGERGHGTPAEIALEAAVREMDRQREIMRVRKYPGATPAGSGEGEDETVLEYLRERDRVVRMMRDKLTRGEAGAPEVSHLLEYAQYAYPPALVKRTIAHRLARVDATSGEGEG